MEEVMHGAVRPVSLQMANDRNGKVEEHSFYIRIPAGVTDGKRIRVPGQGEPGSGGSAAGDLYLRVRHAAHPDFHTEGHDLYYDLDLAPWEAVLGADLTVPTLDGSIKLRVPSGSENGQQLRVRAGAYPKENPVIAVITTPPSPSTCLRNPVPRNASFGRNSAAFRNSTRAPPHPHERHTRERFAGQ